MSDIEKIIGHKYDVIIVGAGPAGCSAATFVANKGYRVLIIDKAIFPRDKICGDGISSAALAILDRIQIIDKIEKANFQKIEGVIVSSPNNCIMKSKNPSVKGKRDYGFVIPRKIFDNILFESLRNIPSIDVLEACKAIDLIFELNIIIGVKIVYQKCTYNVFGKIIIGADGVNSIIAKRISLANRNKKHRAFAIRAYFENVDCLENYLGIHYEEAVLPCYGWIFPINGNSANVGIGVLGRFSDTKNIKELFNIFIEKNKFAREKLKNAKMIEESYNGCILNLGSFPSRRSFNNVILIGDAGSFIDTLTGEGIYYALKSGEYAAMAISSGLKNNSVSNIYEKLWKSDFKWKEFELGYHYQSFLKSKHLINYIISRAHKNQKNAERLAGVISHINPKTKLLYNL